MRLGNVLMLEYCVVITQLLSRQGELLRKHLCSFNESVSRRQCPLSNRHRRVERTSHNLINKFHFVLLSVSNVERCLCDV